MYLHRKFSYLVAILISASAVASGEHEYPASPGSPTAVDCDCFHCESYFSKNINNIVPFKCPCQ